MEKLTDAHLYRVFLRVNDLQCKQTFESMAEGQDFLMAKLRALAEAYEKICWNEFQNRTQFSLERMLPYGFGVGFRQKSAIRRAYGEYWERRICADLLKKNVLGPGLKKQIDTPVGLVFLCFLCLGSGEIGTGYGLNAAQAEDSALRSAWRKKSYPQVPPHFSETTASPEVTRLTPLEYPWLECFCVGTLRKTIA